MKGVIDFFHLHQDVRPVQKQKIQVVGVEPLQTAFDGFDDMVIGKIEETLSDPAF